VVAMREVLDSPVLVGLWSESCSRVGKKERRPFPFVGQDESWLSLHAAQRSAWSTCFWFSLWWFRANQVWKPQILPS